MRLPMQISSAAMWAEMAYRPRLGLLASDQILLQANNLAAYLFPADRGIRTCVVRGSDDIADWHQNVRFWPGHLSFGDSGRLYCCGMIEDARTVYALTLGRCDFFIGHSRGAAVAAIVAASQDKPAVVFAQPRVQWLGSQLPGADQVLTINHTDDWVANRPYAWMGFHHVGEVQRVPGASHSMNAYLETARRLDRP